MPSAYCLSLVRGVNTAVEHAPTKAFAQAAMDMIHEFTQVLGLLYNKKEKPGRQGGGHDPGPPGRPQAKNFAEADRIRDELKAIDIELMDATGCEVEKSLTYTGKNNAPHPANRCRWGPYFHRRTKKRRPP